MFVAHYIDRQSGAGGIIGPFVSLEAAEKWLDGHGWGRFPSDPLWHKATYDLAIYPLRSPDAADIP